MALQNTRLFLSALLFKVLVKANINPDPNRDWKYILPSPTTLQT